MKEQLDISNYEFNYCEHLRVKQLSPLPCGKYYICFKSKCKKRPEDDKRNNEDISWTTYRKRSY